MLIYDVKAKLDVEKDGNIAEQVTPEDRDTLTEAVDAASDWKADAEDASVEEWKEQLEKLQKAVMPIL